MKEKKGFFSRLFFVKSKKDCCNVQFEEVTDENDISENQINTNSEYRGDIENEQAGKKKNENSCGCCNC